MQAFTTLTAVAVPFDETNLDTNQLCPSRFNKVPRGPRFAQILLHDRRFNADGSEKSEHILNQEPYRAARIVVARRNFGVGSSRETAVFGLCEFGIRCVIAPSFGDIFRNNSLKNGLLPVTLPDADADKLIGELKAQRGARITVDLAAQTVIGPDGQSYPFAIQALTKRRLLKGLDDVSLTAEFKDDIARFETAHKARFPWLATVE
jgi:3-isopropylmalate/(R)-2-methylmalate dehydratase small subunit